MIKNTADQTVHFVLVSSTDGSALTSATVTVYVTLDAGTQTTGTGTVQEEGNGQYSYAPTQAETNGDSVGFLFTAAGGIAASLQVYTVSAAVSAAIETAESTALTTAHMSKLQAVNQMLRSINEQAVSSLSSGQIDAERAEAVLNEASRSIQSQGWHANTRRNVEYTPDANDKFLVGANVLSIDTVNPRGARQQNSRSTSSHVNLMLKRAADDAAWLLYDVDNDSETITDLTKVTCDVIEFLRFEHLPPSLQIYVYTQAAHEFQKGSVASKVLYEFTRETVEKAMVDAVQDDARNEDANFFNNSAAREVTYRFNPMYR